MYMVSRLVEIVCQFHFCSLFFADDNFIFFRDNIEECIRVKRILDRYCHLSEKVINLDKSTLMVSRNCHPKYPEIFRKYLGVKVDTNPGKYLGSNFDKIRCKAEFFQPVVERIQKKLQGWKSNLLCAGGKLHHLSCFKAPDKVCNGIDKAIREFYWNSGNGNRKLHLKNWD